MKSVQLLKLALFSFICAIIFSIVLVISHVAPIAALVALSALLCVGSLVAWVCVRIFKKFKHSLNIVLIIVFFSLAAVAWLFDTNEVLVERLPDLMSLEIISIAWISSLMAGTISLLVLIGRLIFAKRGETENVLAAVDAVFDSEEENS